MPLTFFFLSGSLSRSSATRFFWYPMISASSNSCVARTLSASSPSGATLFNRLTLTLQRKSLQHRRHRRLRSSRRRQPPQLKTRHAAAAYSYSCRQDPHRSSAGIIMRFVVAFFHTHSPLLQQGIIEPVIEELARKPLLPAK